MHDLFPLIAEYGAFAVFLNVLLTQAGAPLPAVPTLLVAGALTFHGPLYFMELAPAAVSGALLLAFEMSLVYRVWLASRQVPGTAAEREKVLV